jgi:protein-lysine N-methyltransferase EEF2KMT
MKASMMTAHIKPKWQATIDTTEPAEAARRRIMSHQQEEEMRDAKEIIVVHCWSAPRSRSTALLYSFEARGAETTVALDEPLYGAWLRAASTRASVAVTRPYLSHMLLGGTVPDGATPDEIARWRREQLPLRERIREAALALAAGQHSPIERRQLLIFCKEMAKFSDVYDFDGESNNSNSTVEDENGDGGATTVIRLVHRHVLLIRDPAAVLSSWGAAGTVHGNNPTIAEVGVVPMLSIYSKLQSNGSSSGNNVTVIDSDELVRDPPGVLKSLCDELGVDYSDSM